MINPFDVDNPEYLPLDKFKDIFVREYTEINSLEAPKDYLIRGVRGSGKSMLLYYMEFAHQLYFHDNDIIKLINDKKANKYIGIMVHATRENLKLSHYQTLVDNNLSRYEFMEELCEHDIIMTILYRITKTMYDSIHIRNHLKASDINLYKKLYSIVSDSLNLKNIYDFDAQNDPINILETLLKIFQSERKNITYYINEKLQSKNINYEGSYTNYFLLIDYCKLFKQILKMENYSFYILIDNADDVSNIVQKSINKLIRIREHDTFCLKIAIQKGVYWDETSIQEPHDYSNKTVDELYSTRHSLYFDKTKNIVLKRLQSSIHGEDVDIDYFFPSSKSEQKKLNRIRNTLKTQYEQEYESLKITQKQLPPKQNYVTNQINKNAMTVLFRTLNSPKSYAGFENIVHLSSGIIRQFLDLATKMYEVQTQKYPNETVRYIGLQTQNEVIREYSDSYIDELERKHTQYNESHVERDKILAQKYLYLLNLIEALGEYYSSRLKSKSLKEPRVFTFTLKNPRENELVNQILKLGELENCFQTYWYSTKSGIGRRKGYSLNRRFCPRYTLDHTSFRGRLELDSNVLLNGMKTGSIEKDQIEEEMPQRPITEFME